MGIERIIKELEEENIRYLPRYVIYEYIREVEYAVFEGNLEKEKLYEILYLLSLNPFAKSKIIEVF